MFLSFRRPASYPAATPVPRALERRPRGRVRRVRGGGARRRRPRRGAGGTGAAGGRRRPGGARPPRPGSPPPRPLGVPGRTAGGGPSCSRRGRMPPRPTAGCPLPQPLPPPLRRMRRAAVCSLTPERMRTVRGSGCARIRTLRRCHHSRSSSRPRSERK